MDDGKFGKSGLNLNTAYTYNNYSSLQIFCILSFGWFPGVWFVYVDVSEHVWTQPMKMEERVFRIVGT